MTKREKNLFVIAFLSLAIMAIGSLGPMFIVGAGYEFLFAIIVGMLGLGASIYLLKQPLYEQASASKMIIKRQYTLRDRLGDLLRDGNASVERFKENHPDLYLLLQIGVILVIGGSLCLIFVAGDPLPRI